MKFKELLVVGIFILAIFAIGAVSASENMTGCDDVALENAESSDILEGNTYFDEDFYIQVEENYTQSKRDWNSYELVYIASYSQKNSTVSISVDGAEKQSINVTDGRFSTENDENSTYYKNVYPGDFGLDCGRHNLKVTVNGNTCIDTQVVLSEKENFTIWLQNPYYCEQEYWQSPSFIIIDSNNLNTGTLEIYVNGTRKLAYSVINGYFEEIPDCSNKSRYVAPSDILSGYGTYNVEIRFTENGIANILKNETVSVEEFPPTVDPKLEVYFDLYTLSIPADNFAHIYLPREATGTLTISYNNENKSVSYSKGYAKVEMKSWELNHLGENVVTVVYSGDDFGTLTANGTVIVAPTITSPDYVELSEEFAISMRTHDWVNGKFNVYDYTGNVKGKLLASNAISNGISSVRLSSDAAGLNRYCLEFDYPGGDYPVIRDINVVKNSENVTVSVPNEVEVGSSFNVTITAPVRDFTFAQISVDGADSDFVMLENGLATKSISNLGSGRHTVNVFYENGYYDGGKYVGDIYLNTFTVDVGIKTKLLAPKITTTYNVAKDLVITLKDGADKAIAGKSVIVVLNGKTYNPTTDSKGQVKVSSYNLAPNTYSVSIKFNGNDKYLKSDLNAKLVVVNKASPKITASNKAYKAKTKAKQYTITLKNNKNAVLKNKKVTLTVNKKKYSAKTNSKGKATFKIIKLTKKGTFKAVVKFAGDSCYKSSSKTVRITVKK